MANIRLVVEYDGSQFHGWQYQPGLRTIEGELRRTLETVTRVKISAIFAAGRTDAGVHACGQVVNFHVAEVPDLARLAYSVSSIMRGELSVLLAQVVADDFHARHSAKFKHYRYTILNRDVPPVLDRGRVWHIGSKLDIAHMCREAMVLEGEHDFSSFRAADCSAKSPVRMITKSKLTYEPPYLIYDVIGSGFLKQMVRNIVGTLVGLGKASLGTKSIEEILTKRDRQAAGVTAPAHGLCLKEVNY